MAMFEVEGLHCGYGSNEIIHGIDFRVEPKEVVTILGPNGCGKSTFVKAILGYLRVTRGSVRFRDRDLLGLRPTMRVLAGLGYVPQLHNVFRPLTVRENLEMGGYALDRRALIEAVDRVFEMFPILRQRQGQRAATLSGGERQLLAMARAMMVSPALLFLDEPSAGLAPARAEEVFRNIATIAQAGTAVVVVEQDVYRALAISDRAYVFAAGRAAFEGPAESILGDERIRSAYLGVPTEQAADGQDGSGDGASR